MLKSNSSNAQKSFIHNETMPHYKTYMNNVRLILLSQVLITNKIQEENIQFSIEIEEGKMYF